VVRTIRVRHRDVNVLLQPDCRQFTTAGSPAHSCLPGPRTHRHGLECREAWWVAFARHCPLGQRRHKAALITRQGVGGRHVAAHAAQDSTTQDTMPQQGQAQHETSHHGWSCDKLKANRKQEHHPEPCGLLVSTGKQCRALTAIQHPLPVGVVYARKVLRQRAVTVLLLMPACRVLQHQHVTRLVAAPLLSSQPAHAATSRDSKHVVRMSG
jgi:hypothetical protein